MLILAMDTSGPVCSMALLEGENLLYESVLAQSRGLVRSILPQVEEGLAHCEKSIADVTLLACVTGPGSFTGVRIGVSTAKALCDARDIRCVPVHAFDALALAQGEEDAVLFCPLLDARAGQVYAAAYRRGERVLEDVAEPLEDFVERIRPLGERFCFAGDGSYSLQGRIEELLGDNAEFPPLRHLRASQAGLWAARNVGGAVRSADLHAYYLREPQAVRERKARL